MCKLKLRSQELALKWSIRVLDSAS